MFDSQEGHSTQVGGCHEMSIEAAVVPGTFAVAVVKIVVGVVVKAEAHHSVRESHLQ